VTILAGLPELFEALPNTDGWHDASLKTLRFCVSGGIPLPFELILKYSMNKEVRFQQGFGLSAFGSGIFAMAADDSARKAGSIGRPSFFVDARVVDENNKPVAVGEVGELILKGPSVSYDELMTQHNLDTDGWLHTGDLVTYDDEWFFQIVEHRSNLFRRKTPKTAET